MASHLLVMPEGTVVGSPLSSVASIIPVERKRLPKAPVFIVRHSNQFNTSGGVETKMSFVSGSIEETTSPVHIMDDPETSTSSFSEEKEKVYDYDDDYPSIGASESTCAQNFKPVKTEQKHFADREGSGILGNWEEPEFRRGPSVSFGHSTTSREGSRASFASTIRRRLSWCQTKEDKMRAKFKKGGVEDSVLRDFQETRLKTKQLNQHIRPPVDTTNTSQTPNTNLRSSALIRLDSKLPTTTKPTTTTMHVSKGYVHMLSRWFGSRRESKLDEKRRLPPSYGEETIEDMEFISMLAYEDFMHSPNRPSTVARVFSRFRRS